jgi:photosystem II stability/assembly factor-like uncharacterized protein
MHTLLLVGTKRGLFIFESDATRLSWRTRGPYLVGREIYHAILDARDNSVWAATDHAVWSAHIHRSTDLGENWETLESAPHYLDERSLTAIWFIAPGHHNTPQRFYAGIEPAGLFVSDDACVTWHTVATLNEHPTNATWQPAGGGLALHSIIVDPNDANRIYCALSAGGVYRSEDAGASWQPINRGVRADFQPQRYPETGQCVHKLLLHPEHTNRLYQQNHCGVYRSDDRGDNWTEITAGLPSDFGYALAIDAHDADSVYVIPEESSHMRATPEGKLRVYHSADAGASWRPLTNGLPQENAYVSILREGMTADQAQPCGIYFGTSSGHLFVSSDAGKSWQLVAGYLPRILCVHAVMIE